VHQNWSFARKAVIVGILFLDMFTGFSAPFAGQLNLNQQAALYHKTQVQITYFVSVPPSTCGILKDK
jgi:hypothetical protein